MSWTALAALAVIFLPIWNSKAATPLEAAEWSDSAAGWGPPSFVALPQYPTNSGALGHLEEAMHHKIEAMDAEEKGLGPPPVQLILAPVPMAKFIATNGLDEGLHRELRQWEDARHRAGLLPGSVTNTVAPTNAQTFEVKGYELIGNTLLSTDVTALVLQPYIAPKVTFDTIRQGLTDLQKVYSDRGFATVSVNLPRQTLTNGIVQIRVFEGRLATIAIVKNQYFSSNNVMRALPSLHTNMILNSYMFQSELDRANANQDRQIYPQIEPGAEPGTTDLRLEVKDRLPLHAKLELNNYNSPGTPDLRLNASALYDNLWQLDHSIGIQYGFSPTEYKSGDQWNLFDRPLVANYSGFYRMPLGNPQSVVSEVDNNVGSFGYDEATRRFNLPPPSGQPELNIYASRSTIDTGVTTLLTTNLVNTGTNSLSRQDVQQDLTIDNDIGSRLSFPLWSRGGFQSTFSAGIDYKTYSLTSYKTNIYTRVNVAPDTTSGNLQYITNTSVDYSPVPTTIHNLDYVPLSLRFDASQRDSMGTTTFGLGISANAWFSGSISNLQGVTGSSLSYGHWVVLTPSISREFIIHTNWSLTTELDAQLASEPLPSNEQFGAGGVASVPGYHEGEVFGDDGWHTGVELKTPAHLVGMVAGKQPMTVRGSLFVDAAEVYLIDPVGRPDRTLLWSTGVGVAASIGTHWDARFLFSVPMEATADVPRGSLRFSFGISGQF